MKIVTWLSCQYTHSVYAPHFLGPHDTLLYVLIYILVETLFEEPCYASEKKMDINPLYIVKLSIGKLEDMWPRKIETNLHLHPDL